MAEQSHKREMSEALRGDFERLRERRRGEAAAPPPAVPAPAARPPERLVLTRPPGSTEPAAAPEAEPGPATERAPAGSRLRRLFRRR